MVVVYRQDWFKSYKRLLDFFRTSHHQKISPPLLCYFFPCCALKWTQGYFHARENKEKAQVCFFVVLSLTWCLSQLPYVQRVFRFLGNRWFGTFYLNLFPLKAFLKYQVSILAKLLVYSHAEMTSKLSVDSQNGFKSDAFWYNLLEKKQF